REVYLLEHVVTSLPWGCGLAVPEAPKPPVQRRCFRAHSEAMPTLREYHAATQALFCGCDGGRDLVGDLGVEGREVVDLGVEAPYHAVPGRVTAMRALVPVEVAHPEEPTGAAAGCGSVTRMRHFTSYGPVDPRFNYAAERRALVEQCIAQLVGEGGEP